MMLKKIKAYYMENLGIIAASLASLNGGDYRPYTQ